MSHLIQPIDIEGTKYCIKHGATTPKWRTVSLMNGNMAVAFAEDNDFWLLQNVGGLPGEVNSSGFIRYATCCIWQATVRFTLSSDVAVYNGDVSLNGVVVDSFSRSGSAGETIDILVDLNVLGLIGRACGNRWDISALYEDGDNPGLSVEVVDVTFGPPV